MHTTRRLRFETFEDRRMLSFTPAGSYDAAANLSAIVADDFNNDGKLDLASVGGFSATRVDVRLGDGAGGFGAAQGYSYGNWGYPSSIAAADFDNDDSLDIVVTDSAGFAILMNNGDGTFQSAVVTLADFAQVAVGHFNNDNNIDLVVGWYHWEFGLHYQPYLGNGQGGFAAGLANQIGGDTYNWGNDRLAAVELNNDGKLDVVIGDGRVLLGNGNGTFQYEYGQPVPLSSGAIATGDFTGDGYADVIVSGSSIKVLRSRGDGGFDPPIQHLISGGAVATADFNGDVKLDAIATDGDTGASLLLGNGDGTLHYAGAYATGTLPSGIAVGDFNGDGRPDMAVSNAGSASRNVSILLNDGVWQTEPDLIGDYNLDQRVDGGDFLQWQRQLGAPATPAGSGADGDSSGFVDAGDLTVWSEHFGAPASTAVAEMNLTNLRVSNAKEAVEAQGASEKQRTRLGRDAALAELLVRPAKSLAEFRHTLRTSSAATASFEDSRRYGAHLRWLSQADLGRAIENWPKGKMAEVDQTSDAGDSLLGTADEVIAQNIGDWTGEGVINSTSR